MITSPNAKREELAYELLRCHRKYERADLALTGTVSVTFGTKAVIGVGTLFLSEVSIGDKIIIAGETHVVESIPTNLLLLLETNHVAGASGVSATLYNLDAISYTMADARTDADAVIAALIAATPYDPAWTVTSHPRVKWVSDVFMVDWKRASQGLAVL